MKGKTKENFKDYIDVTVRIPNSYYISKVFERYYLNKFMLNSSREDYQKVTQSFDNVVVQSSHSNGQAYQIPIDKRADAERYINAIDNLMDFVAREENFYYSMIDNYYRHDIKHKSNAMKLKYRLHDSYESEIRRYYRDWDKAVSYFVKEALNRNINLN